MLRGKIGTPGSVSYLFDRKGRWTRFEGQKDRELSYDDVEAAIVQLLLEK